MKDSIGNQSLKFAGCFSNGIGCAIAILLYPICVIMSFYVAFGIAMSCSPYMKCSQSEKDAKNILAIVTFFGGGFGVPIAGGILANKIVSNITEGNPKSRKKSLSD